MKKQEHYDVVVVGGGPAGVAAAIASARNGADTVLIEKDGYLGGMACGASIPAFCTYTNGVETVIRGIGLEILEEMKKYSWKSPFYDDKPDRIEGLDWVPVDTEVLKRVLDELVLSSGCKLMLHTTLVSCHQENNQVTKLFVCNKSGLMEILGDVFIDCTGDGDLAAMAGCSMEYGDENGQVQGGTLCFKVANFDTEKFMDYARQVGENGNLEQAVQRAKADGKFPSGEIKVAGMTLPSLGMASFNFGHVFGWNPVDGVSMTEAEVQARKKLPELLEFIRSYVPGAERAVLAFSGPNIGIRESRRLYGRYRLTIEDYEQRADFADSIAYYAYPVDIHASCASDVADKEKTYQATRYRPGEVYGIPYRCLLPLEMENLLVAGRSVSCDRAMQASLRVMPACFAMGQAAGTAAAMAVSLRLKATELDADHLRTALAEQGVYLKKG